VLDANVAAVYVDSSMPGTMLAGYRTLFRSTDGGATWAPVPGDFSFILRIRADSSHSAIYLASNVMLGSGPALWKSVDGGATFAPLNGFMGRNLGDVAVDTSTTPSTMYTVAIPNGGHPLMVSTDDGETASDLLVNGGVPARTSALLLVGPSSIVLGGIRPGHAFVMSIDTTAMGTESLLYSTFLGGTEDDTGMGIAVDRRGRAYVTGSTLSGDFPLTIVDPPRVAKAQNAWVVVLNAGGTDVVYATQFGGTAGAVGNAIALHAFGAAYIAGSTAGTNGLAFVARLPPDGSSFDVFPVAGTWPLSQLDVAVDRVGAAYLVGTTQSTDFPATENAFQPSYGGGRADGFIAKITFDPNGTTPGRH
jgi:hypothetical protein